MPKLPDVTSFGGRPALQGRGGVPSGDASGVSRAASIFSRSAQDQAGGLTDIGESLFKAGQLMQAAEERSRARTDAVGRATAIARMKQDGETELRDLRTTADLSDAGVLKGLHQSISNKQRELLSQYGGSPDSQAILAVKLEYLRSGLADSASELHFKAGKAKVSGVLGENLKTLNDQVYLSPPSLMTAIVAGEAQIDNFANTMEPDEERAARSVLHETLSQAAIRSMLDSRQVDLAEKILLEVPGIRTMLGGEAYYQVFDRIRQIRDQQAEANKPIILGQDQIAFDASGNVIARGPASPAPQREGFTLGLTRFDAQGKVTARADKDEEA